MKLIAETAWHHEGDFSFMKNLLNEITNNTKTDIVKMHITLDLDEYMDQRHELYNKLKQMLFNIEQWHELISIVRKNGKELMLLLNDTKAIEFAVTCKPQFVELHSVCLNVPHLQNAIIKNLDSNTKIIIGVGGCTIKEVDAAVKAFKNREVILMFGFQNYPTKYEDINIEKIRNIQSMYPNLKFGYADHTGWNEMNNEFITMLVAYNGMSFIEKHVTTNLGVERMDYSAAISLEMLNSLKEKIELLKKVKGDGLIKLNSGEKSYSQYGPMKMAAIANYDLNIGHVLSIKDISFRRTIKKTKMSQIDLISVIGTPLTKPISKNDIFDWFYFGEKK